MDSRPPPIPPRPPGYEIVAPPLPPRQQQQQQYRSSPSTQPPTPHYQQQQHLQDSSPSFPPPPQQPPSSHYQQQQQQQPQQQQQHPQYSPPSFPPPPQQPPPAPSQWHEHLFYSNGRSTPIFEAMMKEFFQRLDSQGTGYIAPEALSSFLDACQYRVEHDVWKSNRKANLMFSAEDIADAELKWALEGFYFDHKVMVRNPGAAQLPYGGMPLLSLAGFTDYIGLELAADPDLLLSGVNNSLRHYGLWPEKGPIPRHVLPPTCPPELQRRIDEGTARCRSAAAEKLNAYKVEQQLKQIGRQNAIELTRDHRYHYTYHYF